MSNLRKYVSTRSKRDTDFADGLESGYEDFKIGVLLRQACEDTGLTQHILARRLELKPARRKRRT